MIYPICCIYNICISLACRMTCQIDIQKKDAKREYMPDMEDNEVPLYMIDS